MESAGGDADALFNYASIRLLSIQLLWSWSSALWMLRVFNNGQVWMRERCWRGLCILQAARTTSKDVSRVCRSTRLFHNKVHLACINQTLSKLYALPRTAAKFLPCSTCQASKNCNIM